MTINYLKNKKYHILASLFCLCYALGAQKVKATTTKVNPINPPASISSTLTYKWNDNSTSYEIDGFEKIDTLYNDNNIALFVGKKHQEMDQDKEMEQQYIFIAHGTFAQQGKKQVRGFFINSRKPISDIKTKTTLKAYSKSWLWGQSFIFSCPEVSLTFYYRKGWLYVDFMEANKVDSTFYREKSHDSTKPHRIQMWEVATPAQEAKAYNEQTNEETKEIVATWKVHSSDIAHIENPSTQGRLYRTLALGNNKGRPYIKLNYGIIGSYIAIVLTIFYAIFHKAINKKVTQLVHKYIPSKKKM